MRRSLVTESIEQITPYVAGKPIEELERELGIRDVLKLASNENPLGPSPVALERVKSVLPRVHLYPDAAAHELRTKLANRLDVPVDEVIVGNGSNELIELVIRTFASPDDEAIISEGTFVVYKMALLAQNVPFREVLLEGIDYDLPAIADAIGEHTKVVILANPNNPTGRAYGRTAWEQFLARVPENVIVLADEAYIEYANPDTFPNALEYRRRHPRLVVTRTFSKIHGLAGLRVGYAVAPAELAAYIHRVRAPFNVSALAQAAALGALDDPGHVERSRAVAREGKAWLRPRFLDLGLTCPESEANFLFVGVDRDAGTVYRAMLERGVIVRPLAGFGFPRHIRITVGLPEENGRVLEALRAALAR